MGADINAPTHLDRMLCPPAHRLAQEGGPPARLLEATGQSPGQASLIDLGRGAAAGMTAAAALADLVLVIAAVAGAVLRTAGRLATARRMCALLMLFDLHGRFSVGNVSYAPAGLNRCDSRPAGPIAVRCRVISERPGWRGSRSRAARARQVRRPSRVLAGRPVAHRSVRKRAPPPSRPARSSQSMSSAKSVSGRLSASAAPLSQPRPAGLMKRR